MKNKFTYWLTKHRDSAFLLAGVLIALLLVEVYFFIQDHGLATRFISSLKTRGNIPISILPGPSRKHKTAFRLKPDQALKLTGIKKQTNERWSDISGNYYSEKFTSKFTYDGKGAEVLVAIEEKSDTLRGRLEAKGLKPNFAYQIKLRGLFEHFESFERIGYAGRWRFPGKATNFTDVEYRARKDKSDVESYLFFDFFITDKNGNAIRDLELDSSLHVLWNAKRQRSIPNGEFLVLKVDAQNPGTYSSPKKKKDVEFLWAERERNRYSSPDQKRFLPPGKYEAELVLTEESFHSMGNDGGYWATVFKGRISFVVE